LTTVSRPNRNVFPPIAFTEFKVVLEPSADIVTNYEPFATHVHAEFATVHHKNEARDLAGSLMESSSNSARDEDADAEVQTHALTRNAVVGLPLLEPNDCPKIKDDECEGTSQDTCGDHKPHAVDNVIIDQAPPYDCDDGASQGACDDHEIPNTDKPIDNSSLAPSYFCAHSSESDSDTDNYQPDFFKSDQPLDFEAHGDTDSDQDRDTYYSTPSPTPTSSSHGTIFAEEVDDWGKIDLMEDDTARTLLAFLADDKLEKLHLDDWDNFEDQEDAEEEDDEDKEAEETE
jgi:hypothetical protein